MELHQVRYFIALVDTSSFTRAAETCGVSQPSLTRAVRKLEEELGSHLFNRHRKGTTLTEFGEIMLPYFSAIATQAEMAADQAVTFAHATRATLRLGVMCTISPTSLLSLIKGICVCHPEITLKITDFTARRLENLILNGDLDVAMYAETGEPNERLHYSPLFRERMMIALKSDHRLAPKSFIAYHELCQDKYINRVNCEFNGADIWSNNESRWSIAHKSDRDDWILAMVAAGMGFGFLPAFSVRHVDVLSRPLVEPEVWRDVSIVTLRGRRHSPAVGALVREAVAVKWDKSGHFGNEVARPISG